MQLFFLNNNQKWILSGMNKKKDHNGCGLFVHSLVV